MYWVIVVFELWPSDKPPWYILVHFCFFLSCRWCGSAVVAPPPCFTTTTWTTSTVCFVERKTSWWFRTSSRKRWVNSMVLYKFNKELGRYGRSCRHVPLHVRLLVWLRETDCACVCFVEMYVYTFTFFFLLLLFLPLGRSPTSSNAKDYFTGYARFYGNSIIFWIKSGWIQSERVLRFYPLA